MQFNALRPVICLASNTGNTASGKSFGHRFAATLESSELASDWMDRWKLLPNNKCRNAVSPVKIFKSPWPAGGSGRSFSCLFPVPSIITWHVSWIILLPVGGSTPPSWYRYTRPGRRLWPEVQIPSTCGCAWRLTISDIYIYKLTIIWYILLIEVHRMMQKSLRYIDLLMILLQLASSSGHGSTCSRHDLAAPLLCASMGDLWVYGHDLTACTTFFFKTCEAQGPRRLKRVLV